MEEMALGRRDGHLVGRGETYKDMEMGCGERTVVTITLNSRVFSTRERTLGGIKNKGSTSIAKILKTLDVT